MLFLWLSAGPSPAAFCDIEQGQVLLFLWLSAGPSPAAFQFVTYSRAKSCSFFYLEQGHILQFFYLEQGQVLLLFAT